MSLQLNKWNPSPPLNGFIKEYYFIEITSGSKEKSIPIIDDCSYDIVFFKEANAFIEYNPTSERMTISYKVFTIHQLIPPFKIGFKDQLSFFTIKLQPWFNASLFKGFDTHGIKDLSQILTESHLFHKNIFENITNEERFLLAEAFARHNIPQTTQRISLVKDMCQYILKKNGQLSVNELSEHYQKSRQYLNSIFKKEVLYPLKKYITTVRILSLVKYRIKHKDLSLTQLSYDYGYFDQAHFNHDFRNVCGVKPKKFFDNLPEFLLRH